MEFDPVNQYAGNGIEDDLNFRQKLEDYFRHTKWFLISALVFVVIAFLFLRYSSPKYEATATILIKDNEKGSSISGLSAFESLGLFADAENSLENEIHIIKSRKLITQVTKELQLNYRYYLEDSPIDIELYTKSPISLNFGSDDQDIDNINTEFYIEILSKNSFNFKDFKENKITDLKFDQDFDANLGNEIIDINKNVSIELNDNFSDEIIGQTIKVKINSLNGFVDNLMLKVFVEPVNSNISKVIKISLKETVREKAVAIINNLIEQYNADGNNDKNLVAQTTTDFLDDRIVLIQAELYAIEGTAEQFKSKNQMVAANDGASLYLQSSSLNERDLVAANTELQLINYMLDELNKTNESDLLPGNIGLSDMSIVNMITQYNELVLQRNRVLKSSSTKNPIIVGIDSQLNVLKDNLVGSLNNLRSSTEIQIGALNRQGGKISSKIASVPKNEREFKDIVRKQETKNALYLFMLQKREESILSNAVDVNKAKIIDWAYSGALPVSPKRSLVYLAALFIGLLIPFLTIYLSELLDTKVRNEKDIAKLKIPYLGDIPLAKSKKNLFLDSSDNSNVAEAFRYIRTNISFMLDKSEFGRTVFVTSTQGGEGKSFTAINLASSLALSGKKTIIITLDLRAPKIAKYLDLDESIGVTNFIVNKDLSIDDILEKHTRIDGLHFIDSGDIPPNPVELLMSKRVDEIFEYVKSHYQYVIVDTAPVGMVTDTIQVNKFSDVTIYIIKANYLDKRMLHIPKKMNEEKKLKNMAILLNGTNNDKGRYGYGYGYGTVRHKSWLKKLIDTV